MKLILCIWVGIQISSLVIEFCPRNSLCQSYCLMLLLSPEWHDLLARFFCRTVEHDVETNWIIFGLRWDLGFFVGVSLSQACFPFFALFLDSNGQMKLDWLYQCELALYWIIQIAQVIDYLEGNFSKHSLQSRERLVVLIRILSIKSHWMQRKTMLTF